MTDLSDSAKLVYKAKHKIRFVTAASLFDGHDASINIMRRILQASGAEVIHLGHNRSVEEIVSAALQEDVQGIAVSSYQGGHIEFFKYMLDLLRSRGGEHVKVFGGGGGVIVPAEIKELQDYGVARIYSPEDGQRMGLQGMINDMLARCDFDPAQHAPKELKKGDLRALAQTITALESGVSKTKDSLHKEKTEGPVLGVTGTGGAGKSSLTDELVRRFRLDQGDDLRIAVLSVDPTRRKTGGALLGDRIRMNAIHSPGIFMRSFATREAGSSLSAALGEAIAACKAAGFELIIVETAGIGQGDAAIVPHADVSLYVMTPEFGAASQLEKIDMLDFADFVAINKFDRKGAEDALRDVRKQVQRNRQAFGAGAEQMPVFGTIASRFNDDGVTALYHAIAARLAEKGLKLEPGRLPRLDSKVPSDVHVIIPPKRQRVVIGHQGSQGRAAEIRGPRRAAALAPAREPAGRVSVHRRGVPLQARERGSDAHVRRRRQSLPHQPALPPAVEGPAREAPVDRVRLGDAVRLRPRRTARHLRQGRQLGRVDRHARRHGGAVLRLRPVRSGHLGVDDHQRPGADPPRDVLQHRDRPAGGEVFQHAFTATGRKTA